jgi:Fe-S cluster assembly protein SufD
MTTRTVVSRTRRSETAEQQDFRFQPEWTATPNSAAAFVQEYRKLAWEDFQRIPMPTNKDDHWRRTELRGLEAGRFAQAAPGAYRRMQKAPRALLRPLADQRHGGQIVIVPGEEEMTLAPELAAQGVVFCDLITAQRDYPELLRKILGQVVNPSEGKFAAMAGAMAQQGVLLYVPPGLQVDQPLQSILWGPGADLAFFSHLLVYIDDGASATYIHEAASPDDSGQSMHAGIVEIHVGNNAKLHFVELQSWGNNVWNFRHERARVQRDGEIDWIFGAIGSHLTKNFTTLDLVGRGALGRMSGFYFTDGIQHLDHDTQQNHLAPNTTSDLLFKGALQGHSRSVWQGMIYVSPEGQKTDGYQANRNLVLSPKARSDSLPGLEILADDVRCTHGATVGKIDAEQVFYLLSRGIPYAEAERLIVAGFFDPIMQRIPFEGVRSRFQQSIVDKMGKTV